jgi:hypothetical protein
LRLGAAAARNSDELLRDIEVMGGGRGWAGPEERMTRGRRSWSTEAGARKTRWLAEVGTRKTSRPAVGVMWRKK